MAWKKTSPGLIELFDAALPADPRAERRQMFGYPCAFVGGHMFCGLHEENLFVRLGPSEREALLRRPGAAPWEPLPGRPMKEYVIVPPGLRTSRFLRPWLERALAYAAMQPPKAKKASKARRPPATQKTTRPIAGRPRGKP